METIELSAVKKKEKKRKRLPQDLIASLPPNSVLYTSNEVALKPGESSAPAHSAMQKTFLAVTVGKEECYWHFMNRKTRDVVNILQCREQFPLLNYSAQNINSAKAEKPQSNTMIIPFSRYHLWPLVELCHTAVWRFLPKWLRTIVLVVQKKITLLSLWHVIHH